MLKLNTLKTEYLHNLYNFNKFQPINNEFHSNNMYHTSSLNRNHSEMFSLTF